jgi:hypothetical protein
MSGVASFGLSLLENLRRNHRQQPEDGAEEDEGRSEQSRGPFPDAALRAIPLEALSGWGRLGLHCVGGFSVRISRG